jgi:hypothetical protein
MPRRISVHMGTRRAIVSDEDYESLRQWTWWLKPSGHIRRKLLAAERRLYNISATSIGKQIFQNRGIQIPHGMSIDHINRNPLDNRIENLRLASQFQQTLNQGPYSNGSVGYKGVSISKGKFVAQFGCGRSGSYKHIGTFTTDKEAARAYDHHVWGLYRDTEHAPFVYLNFPNEVDH